MEVKKIDLEQPEKVLNSQGEEVSQKTEDRVELNEIEGSKYGKFRDAETLLNAYNNLQSDYTKKCQALSQLQKECEDKGLNKSPEQLSKDWEEKVKSFFEANVKAKKYEKDLANIIMQDKEIASSDNPLDNAWNKFLKENFMDKDELALDEDFLQKYIYSNNKIKNKIMEDYFSVLSLGDAPTLISAQRGSKTFLSPPNKPKTIKEAGKIAEDLF